MLNSMNGFPAAAAPTPAPLSGTVAGVRTKFSVRVEVELVEVVVEGVPLVVETAPDPVVLVGLELAELSVMVPLQSELTL
jgi:hypothetical protein